MAHSDGTHPWAINAQAGDPDYDALTSRRLLRMLMFGGVSDRLGARAGVHPHFSPATPAVSLSGQQITVHTCNAVIYPGESNTDGPYLAYFLEHTHTLDPADGSNPRIDIVVARVYDDDHDSSGDRHAVTEYIPGTPDPSPSQPATPAGALLLATIDVPAGGSPSPSLDYVAPWTVASGGILPVRDSSELPGAGRYDGMAAWDQDERRLLIRTGGSWVPVAAPTGWETLVNTTITGSTNLSFQSGVYEMLRVRLRGNLTSVNYITMRINNDDSAGLHREAYTTFQQSNGSVVDSDATNGTTWNLAQWSESVGCVAEATIYNTNVSSLISFEGSGARPAATTTLRTRTISSGILSANRLPSSIRFGGSGVSAPDTVRVWIEGYRP